MEQKSGTVIMEYLATDYPEPLTTLFYTSAFAQREKVQPTSEKVFEFSGDLTLQELVTRFHSILRPASIPFTSEPQDLDDTVEHVKIRYNPKEGPPSKHFHDVFMPLLYASLGLLIKQDHATQIKGPPIYS